MNRTPIIPINRDSPRAIVQMHWGDTTPAGAILLYVKRAGEPAEFAAYPPLSIDGGSLLFEFDELLFAKKQGRYLGRLVIGVEDFGTIQLQYTDPTYIQAVKPNVYSSP